MRLVLCLVLASTPALAGDELDDWVAQKVREQRTALEPRQTTDKPGAKNIWRERDPRGRSPIPGFTPPTSLAPLVKAVRPGVVNIATRNEGSSRSLGSGFVITPDGLVVTNNHVVERAQEIVVRLADGRELEATIVGRDPQTDLALLRLDGAKGLPCVVFGDSDLLEVGDWVVAIGNPFGLDTSVTHGLISARERVIGIGPFDDFIQTNALINPGNSGGPLFDMKGEVVGVTTAILNHGQGIGFAVPINFVKDLLPNLLDNGRPDRGWLGVNVQETGEGTASVVVDVYKDSPAQKAGVRAGDRLVSYGGKPVERYQQLLRRIALQGPGATVKLGLVRAGKPLEVSATLIARPSTEALRTMFAGGNVESLGLTLKELDPAVYKQLGIERGLRVEAVLPDSAAELAGIISSDVVIEVNRVAVGTMKEVQLALGESPPGEPVLLRYKRGATTRYVALRPR